MARHGLSMDTVELSVRMDCKGCEKEIRRALRNVKGIDALEIDVDRQKVTVMGYIDRYKVLEKVRKTGKRAEFWPYGPDVAYLNYDPVSYHGPGSSFHGPQPAALPSSYPHNNNNNNYAVPYPAYPPNNIDYGVYGPRAYPTDHGVYAPRSSESYRNPHGRTIYHHHRSRDPVTDYFNDENPSSCSIM